MAGIGDSSSSLCLYSHSRYESSSANVENPRPTDQFGTMWTPSDNGPNHSRIEFRMDQLTPIVYERSMLYAVTRLSFQPVIFNKFH